MAATGTSWRTEQLVALDLEGSGAQDRDKEALLEVAVVPLLNGQPDVDNAYATMVNPGRKIRQGPWISPGLTNSVLAGAPPLGDVEPNLAKRLDRAVIVGHNIGVDWRLLHRRCPAIQPRALLDTLRLAKHVRPTEKARSLTSLLDRHELTGIVNKLASASQPHRALWDTTAAALLLAALTTVGYDHDPTLEQLIQVAAIPLDLAPTAPRLF
ncbi:MAG: 3'-5' exonuclease [Acidimicrobiales bacterium]